MSVRFVAIVNAQNEPIYFRAPSETPAEVQTNLQFIAEMSLDFIEQAAPQMHENLQQPEMVLLHEGIAVYAMLQCTNTKFIIGVDSIGDNSQVGKLIHLIVDAFVGYQCNPFGNKERVESVRFDEKIKEICSV